MVLSRTFFVSKATNFDDKILACYWMNKHTHFVINDFPWVADVTSAPHCTYETVFIFTQYLQKHIPRFF
jgi:hypothetical protein